MLRLLFVLVSICFLYTTASADPIQLTGTATGSFNGNPLSTSASLAGVTFTGGAFSFDTLPSDPFQQFALGTNALAVLSYNGSSAGIAGTDTFTLNLAFQNGTQISWSFRVTAPVPNIIVFSPLDPGNRAISFTSGSHVVEGFLTDPAIDNLRPFFPISSIRDQLRLTSVTPPVETPEPGSLVLLGIGILGGARVFRRMRR